MAELRDRFERLISSFSIDEQRLMMGLWERYCYEPNADDRRKILDGLFGMVKGVESDIYDCCEPNIREYIVPDWVECAHRICDAYRKQMGQSARDALLQSKLSEWGVGGAEQQQQDEDAHREVHLPQELDTDEAQRYFKKAVELGLMSDDYEWLKGLQMLACFAREMSLKLKLGKGDRFSWKPFECLFGVQHGKLRLNYNDIQKTGQQPMEAYLIDQIFE